MSAERPLSRGRKIVFAFVAWALVLGALEAGLAATEPMWSADADEANEAVPLTRKEQERASDVVLGANEQRRMGDTLRFHVRSNVLTQHDPELLFRVKANPSGEPIHGYTGINAQGFRGQLLEAPRSGVRSILILGDSCGFGWGIHDYAETIAGRLEDLYARPIDGDARSAPRVVSNLSQPGYSSEQARMLFERWAPTLEPDVTVVYLGWNDLFLSGDSDRTLFERLKIANAPGLRLARSTHVYRAIESAMRAKRGDGAVPDSSKDSVLRVSRERSVENLRTIALQHRDRGAYVVIVPPPSLPWMRKGGMPEYIASLRAGLSDVALFLELPELHPDSPQQAAYYIKDGFHPNARGAAYIAAQIVRADIALEELEAKQAAPRR